MTCHAHRRPGAKRVTAQRVARGHPQAQATQAPPGAQGKVLGEPNALGADAAFFRRGEAAT
ncbi:MAG: hypothetical protein ACKO3C_07230 [Betaproteobacteria bacterium]